MPYAALPESYNAGSKAAIKAARRAAAAKTALSSAGQSMIAVLRKHQSSSWNGKLISEESLNQFSIGSKTLWNKLQKGPRQSNAGKEMPKESNACSEASLPISAVVRSGPYTTDEDESVTHLSEISTCCSASQGCLSESEQDDEAGRREVLSSPVQPTEGLETLTEDDDMVDDAWHWPPSIRRPTTCNELMQETMFWPRLKPGMHLDAPRYEIWQLQFSVTSVGYVETLQRSVPADVAHQIELDVPRARPRCMNEAHRATLRRVLRAYAVYDAEVGYCQGMSDIAAVFVLLGFDESAALCGLCSLMQTCCPDYFCPSLKGYVRDVQVLQKLIAEILPETDLAVQSLEVPLDTLAANHFFTLASHTWPLESVVLLWDLLFLKGLPAVFASFMALLELYLPKDADSRGRLSTQSCVEGPERVEEFTKAMSEGIVEDISTVLEHTRQLIPCISMSRVESLRRKCTQ